MMERTEKKKDRLGGREEEIPLTTKQDGKFGFLHINEDSWCLKSYCTIMARYLNDVCRSQWPRGLMRRSSAARPLRLWVRIPLEAWTFVCCECCQVEVPATD
jgi:hypothetical protein